MTVGAAAAWPTVTIGAENVPVMQYRCSVCSNPVKSRYDGDTCWACGHQPNVAYEAPGIDMAWAATVYLADVPTFPSNRVVVDSKKRPDLTLAMMHATAELWKKECPWMQEGWMPDIVVPCPSSRERDFPRSYPLGQGVSNVMGLPLADILTRTDNNPPRSKQTHKKPPATFTALLQEVTVEAKGLLPAEAKVLLVDDLLTLGVTSASSAWALRQAGASEVRLLAFARHNQRGHLEAHCD
jgi:predicted amidophosphoribosyltransferase